MTALSPRERVQLALDHKETDRVPVDLLATEETWANLQRHLALDTPEAICRHLGVDLRHPRMEYIGPPHKHLPDGSYIDAWGILWKPQDYGLGVYYEIGNSALGHITDASELADCPWPDPGWWDVGPMVDYVRALDKETPYALALEEFGDPGGFFEISWYLRGMEQFMIDMVMNPDIAHEILRRVTDVYMSRLESVMAALGERVDLIWTSDDIAHQQGLLLSLDMWRTFIYPHHERFNRRVHELGAKVMYHSCGAVLDAIPGLIEMGIDVLDVLQFSAAKMDPTPIKERFGDRLCFHGGADVQGLLPKVETPEEVRRALRPIIDIMGESGGFILSPSHNIQADVSPEKIIAVYQAAGSIAS